MGEEGPKHPMLELYYFKGFWERCVELEDAHRYSICQKNTLPKPMDPLKSENAQTKSQLHIFKQKENFQRN